MPDHKLIRIPTRFLDDHESRELDTPEIVRRSRRHAWIYADDPHLPELASDARFYADPYGPRDFEGARALAAAARALLRALQRAEAMLP